MYYSYSRVSTEKQEYLRQDKAIKEYCESKGLVLKKAYKDKITGKTFDRPEFNKLKEIIKAGDTVIIKELDRLGRDWDGIRDEWMWFSDKNVNVFIIDSPVLSESIYNEDGTIDLSKKLIQKMMFELLSYVSETERKKVNKRTSEALQALKASGIKLGKPVNEKRNNEIVEMFKEGINKADIAFFCECSRQHVYNVLKENELI